MKHMVPELGDGGLWNIYTVHGGGFNMTTYLERRPYINGFIRTDQCHRGEWGLEQGGGGRNAFSVSRP